MVVVFLLISALAEVDNFATGRGGNRGGFGSLRVPNDRGFVVVLATGKMEESGVILESALLLQLVK